MTIFNFQLNRKKKISELQIDLISFISSFIKKKEYKLFLKTMEKELCLSIKTLEHETKIFLFSKFINNKGKFSKIFSLFCLPLSVLEFLLIFSYLKFFEKKKIRPKINYFDILIDGIDRNIILRKYEKIKKKKKALFLVYDKKAYFNNFKNIFYFNYRNINLEEKKKISFIRLIRLLCYSIFFSLKLRENLVPILTNFLKKYYKYNSIFFINRSKSILQERFYDSSAIKDEIFHQYNGKLSCLLQKNLFQINGPGMFTCADILFSLGSKSYPYLKNFDCKIKKIIPVGSLFMESDFFNYPNIKRLNGKKFSYDILIFASSHTRNFHSGYDNYYFEYYEHFEWIKKIALKYPELNIAIKHKKNFNDMKEISIFKGVKNIKYIVDQSTDYSDSYVLGSKAKSLFTWSSTLGFELMSLKKNCFFLDPKNSNHSFLPNNKTNNLIRITNFKKFENIFKKNLNNKNVNLIKNYDNYCFDSRRTSENIINYLDNIN